MLKSLAKPQCRTRVSSSATSKLNKTIYKKLEAWREQPIESEYPYVYLDRIVLKRTWAGEVMNVSVLVAIGVDGEGNRNILGVQKGHKEKTRVDGQSSCHI